MASDEAKVQLRRKLRKVGATEMCVGKGWSLKGEGKRDRRASP